MASEGESRQVIPKVFVVDDHELIRQALKTVLERSDDLEFVGEAAHVDTALRGIEDSHPDVAVVDLHLGSESGIDLCVQIRARAPDVKLLILTGFLDEEHLVKVIAAGAAGYMLKDAPMSDIAEGIREVAAGRTVLEGAAGRASTRRGAEVPEDEPGALSDRESRILDLVAGGLTNRQIASRLGIAEQTVKNHVSRLLQKLGLESRTQAAVYATTRRAGRRSRPRGT